MSGKPLVMVTEGQMSDHSSARLMFRALPKAKMLMKGTSCPKEARAQMGLLSVCTAVGPRPTRSKCRPMFNRQRF
jgi:hypothetical protein